MTDRMYLQTSAVTFNQLQILREMDQVFRSLEKDLLLSELGTQEPDLSSKQSVNFLYTTLKDYQSNLFTLHKKFLEDLTETLPEDNDSAEAVYFKQKLRDGCEKLTTIIDKMIFEQFVKEKPDKPEITETMGYFDQLIKASYSFEVEEDLAVTPVKHKTRSKKFASELKGCLKWSSKRSQSQKQCLSELWNQQNIQISPSTSEVSLTKDKSSRCTEETPMPPKNHKFKENHKPQPLDDKRFIRADRRANLNQSQVQRLQASKACSVDKLKNQARMSILEDIEIKVKTETKKSKLCCL